MFDFRLISGIPVSDQLESHIAELIISGEMKQEEKLPAVREVARELTINPNTVQKTYQRLEQRGLIYSFPGKGSYVAGRECYIGEVMEKAKTELAAAVRQAAKSGLSKQDILSVIEEMRIE